MGKNHHYVSQFYLRNFSMNEKAINTYVVKSDRTVKVAAISKQCYRVNGYKRQEIEDHLCTLEGEQAELIRWVLNSQKGTAMPDKIKQGLIEFVALSHVRNINQIEVIKSGIHMMIESLNKDNKGGKLYEDLKKTYEQHDTVLQSLSLYKKIAGELSDLRLVVVNNESEKKFITCDNPIIIYNPLFQDIKGVSYRGVTSYGVVIYVPVSPYKALMLFDEDVYRVRRTSNLYVDAYGEDVSQLNSMTVVNSKECLYGDESISDYIANTGKQFKKVRSERSMVLSEAQNEQDDRRTLLHSYENFPNLDISLSFMSISERVKSGRMEHPRYRKHKKVKTDTYVSYKHMGETEQYL